MRSIAFALLGSLFASASIVAQTFTTWTGAVSTSFGDPNNWTNLAPNAYAYATIPLTANQPVVSPGSTVRCERLSMGTGATLDLGDGTLEIYGVAGLGQVHGTGWVSLRPNLQFVMSQSITCAPSTSIPNLTIEPGLSATCTNLNVRGMLQSASANGVGPTITLHGTTQLGSALFFGLPQGHVVTDPNGALLVTGMLESYWNIDIPATCAVGTLRMNPTSSVTPTGGVVNIPPGFGLFLECSSFGAVNLNLNVPSGASFRLSDGQPSSPNHLDFTDTSGSITIESSDRAEIRCDRVDGSMQCAGDCRLQPLTTSGVTVPTGASLTITSAGMSVVNTYLRIPGTLQVDGALRVGLSSFPGSLVLEDVTPANPGRLVIEPTGSLVVEPWSQVLGDGNHHAEVIVRGSLAARSALFKGLGPNGLVLASTSTIAAAPYDLGGSTFDDGAPVPGSSLLTIARTAPTRLDGVWFAATNSTATHGVKAVTPYAVDVRNSPPLFLAPLSSEAFEYDPLAVISWTNGVSFHGIGTPGCHGLAENRTNVAPQVGTAGFALRCRNAHPSGLAIQAIGAGGLATAFSLLGVDLWLDPAAPVALHSVAVDALGTADLPLPIPNNPQLVGASLYVQALPFELPGCMPYGLSASTAIRFTILP
jgi:hypothetical protein